MMIEIISQHLISEAISAMRHRYVMHAELDTWIFRQCCRNGATYQSEVGLVLARVMTRPSLIQLCVYHNSSMVEHESGSGAIGEDAANMCFVFLIIIPFDYWRLTSACHLQGLCSQTFINKYHHTYLLQLYEH